MPLKTFRLFFFIGFPLAVCGWILLLFAAAGYQYEVGKFKSILFTTAVVLLSQFIVGDPIKFVFQALWQTFIDKNPEAKPFRYGIPRAKKEKDDIRLLKMRIDWGKSRLSYNWRHRDEGLNLFYKNVARDLITFGRFFLSLILLVVILNEPLSFHHSDGLRQVFSLSRTSGREVENLPRIADLYNFIETNIINVLDPKFNDLSNTQELNWVSDEMSKMIGVVRLMQVRLKHKLLGLDSYEFTDAKYLPKWKPYVDYSYKKQYWRTYEPWLPTKVASKTHYDNTGYLSDYPTDNAYISLMSRKTKNNRQILEFLQSNTWLDDLTAVLFIDFVVYNVDSNLFGLCQIVAEHTPFGNIVFYFHFESVVFLIDWSRSSKWYWVVLLVYVLQLIFFAKRLMLKLWYGSVGSLISIWILMDCVIIVANILVFIFIYLRTQTVVKIMETLEKTSKEQYLSFQSAKYYGRNVEICLAILVFCATIRLWKVLLFARVFRLYVRTLVLGAADIFWALLNIMVYLIGLTISSYVINGTSITTTHVPLSLVHLLSFSLGYSERVNPIEKSQIKTSTLGLIIYALMMFGVTLVLLNMLITLICIHYAKAKEEERERPQPNINFWQFLKVEYSPFFNFFNNMKKKIKRKLRGQFFDKIQRNLWNVEHKLGVHQKKKHEHNLKFRNERQSSLLRRTRIMTDILLTQTEILNRRLRDLNIRLDGENL